MSSPFPFVFLRGFSVSRIPVAFFVYCLCFSSTLLFLYSLSSFLSWYNLHKVHSLYYTVLWVLANYILCNNDRIIISLRKLLPPIFGSSCFFFLQSSAFPECYINRIIQYITHGVQLLLLCVIYLWFIHIVLHFFIIGYFFLLLHGIHMQHGTSTCWMYHSLTSH